MSDNWSNRKIAHGGISDLANTRSPDGGNMKATKPRKGKGRGISIVPGKSLGTSTADAALSQPSKNQRLRPKKRSPPGKRAGYMAGRKRDNRSNGEYLEEAEYAQSKRQSGSGQRDKIASVQSYRKKKQRLSSSIIASLDMVGDQICPKRQQNFGTPNDTPPKSASKACELDLDEYQNEPDSQEEWRHIDNIKTIEIEDSEEDNANQKNNTNDASGEFANDIINNLNQKKDMKRQQKNSSLLFSKVNNNNDHNARNKRSVTRDTNDQISDDEMNAPGRTISSPNPRNRVAHRSKSKKLNLDDFNDSDEDYFDGGGIVTKVVDKGKRLLKRTCNKFRNAIPGKRRTRSSPRQKQLRVKKSSENEVIELSSDEESIGLGQELVDDGSVDEDLDGHQNGNTGSNSGKFKTNFSPTGNDTMRSTRTFGARRVCPATRIAIGKQIFQDSCFLNYQPGASSPYLRFEYTDGSLEKCHKSFIKDEEVVELHYYIPKDEVTSCSSQDEVASCSSKNDDEKAAMNTVNNHSDHVASDPNKKCDEENALEGSGKEQGMKSVGKSSDEDRTTKDSGDDTGDDEVVTGGKESDKGIDEAITVGKVSDEDMADTDSVNGKAQEGITGKNEINTPHTTSLSNEPNPCCYLIMRIKPSARNKLSSYPNKYLPDDQYPLKEGASKDKKKKRFVVIETKDKTSLQVILDEMRKDDHLAAFLCLGCGLNKEQKDSYITTFQAKTRKKAKYKEHDTVLVFPFQAHEAELNSAAKDLIEASGKLSADRDSMFARNPTSASNPAENPMAKVHTVTIHGEDYDRLVPCEFLNDTLIDFWISWLTRRMGEAANNVHVFTTQFFSKLEEEGAAAVSSWTAKKGIDIFEKKFIFIPVNKDIHWSLFVIVNPGKVENANDNLVENDDDVLEHPFLLFMDSLRAHKKKKIWDTIRKWLNAEAKRLGKFKRMNTDTPFSNSTFPVVDPRVPYQDNSWDCGVFVCRYAFSMLHLINVSFEQKHSEWTNAATRRAQVTKWITKSPEFDFDMRDIARLRQEIANLIDSLSTIYSLKIEQKNKKKKLLAEKKKEESEESKKKFQGVGSMEC